MTINRSGECPKFIKYVTEQALLPYDKESTNSEAFQQHCQYGTLRWIDIPNYQRGLVWKPELLEELLSSTSLLLGNAVLAQFNIPDRSLEPYNNIPGDEQNYAILIDGLQRFSIGTAILNIVYDLVLAETAELKSLAPQFQAFKMAVLPQVDVFQYNHRQLKSHPRQAVSDSYQTFYKRLLNWLRSELSTTPNSRAERIADLHRLFLQRQISPDIYSGFSDVNEVIDTFIGLNTTRVQLNIVDWLRSIFIDKGSKSGWTIEQLSEAENLFTNTFYDSKTGARLAELEPFAAIIKKVLTSSSHQVDKAFPSMASEGKLDISEFTSFLEYVQKVQNTDDHPYVNELRNSGGLPYAGLLAYGYRKMILTGALPSFVLDGKDPAENAALHNYLRANYRVLLDGRIGRTGPFAEKLISITPHGENDQNTMEDVLITVANEQSIQFIDTSINSEVSSDWLRSSLKKADRKRCQRVFNAMILPKDPKNALSFIPHQYGTSTDCYQVDHLIANSALKKHLPGGLEGQQIVNFAPVRQVANNAQSNLKCSEKLQPNGSFARELDSDTNVHPLIDWLVKNQGTCGIQNDIQELLEPNATTPIGDDRLDFIVKTLGKTL